MSSERLVLPFENDVPVGYVTERLTMAMLAEAEAGDGWTYTAGEWIVTRIETRNALSADLADRIGLSKFKLFSDQDEYVHAARTTGGGIFYNSVYRVRFDAGQVAGDDEPVAEDAVFQKGTVVRYADGLLYVLWPLPDRLDYCCVAREHMDACRMYDMSVYHSKSYKQLSFVRVYTRDDYVLK